MIKNYITHTLPLYVLLIACFTSCKKEFEADDYAAYFGGEVQNPQSNYVVFMKDNEVIDTLYLDKNNRFMHKFDSLAPGLYTFKHDPEYQYVYFDKNDSLMVRLNAVDFDNSIVFCGRGDEKNNFLMEMYLKNEEDKATMYTVFDRNVPSFLKNIDSSFAIRKSFYLKRKAEIGWDDTFDSLAKASLDFHHITKKEIYPYAHQFRNGKNIRKALPADYYAHRKAVNYESNELANYSPFIKYVSMMLNNMTYEKNKGNLSENSIENNIEKLNLTKNLIKNEKTRNVVLNNVALMYLLEDQNMYNNTKFIERYLELSTDAALEKEIRTIYTAVQNLKVGNNLPKIDLVNAKNEKINLTTLITKPTVLYFWTTHAESHMAIAHQKINALQKEHPNYQFIAINIDDTQPNWNEALKKYQLNSHFELHATDFEAIRNKWVITKIHRIIILNADGTIKNGFANLFDVNFENQLQ